MSSSPANSPRSRRFVERVKAYRHAVAELADLDQMIADPATDAEMRAAVAGEERPLLERKREEMEQEIRPRPAAQGCDGRAQRHP